MSEYDNLPEQVIDSIEPIQKEPENKSVGSWYGIIAAVLVIIAICYFNSDSSTGSSKNSKRFAKEYRYIMARRTGDIRIYSATAPDAIGKNAAVIKESKFKAVNCAIQEYKKGMPDERLAVRILLAKSLIKSKITDSDFKAIKPENREIWNSILGTGSIAAFEIPAYKKAVEKMRFGRLEPLVLQHLYINAGDRKAAALELEKQKNNAISWFLFMILLFICAVAAFILGLVSLILGLINLKRIDDLPITTGIANGWDFLVYIAIYLSAPLVAWSIPAFGGPGLFVAVELLTLVFVVMWLKRVGRDACLVFNRDIAKNIGLGIVGWLSAVPLLVISMLAASTFSDPNRMIDPITIYMDHRGWVTVAFMLTASVVGPIVEEIAFRGILLDTFRSKMGFWWAALLSSFLFGMMHLNFSIKLLPTFCLGMVFCYLRRKTGSLTASCVCHMVNNTVATLMFLLF